MKKTMVSLMVAFAVFPTVPSKHAQEVDALADAVMQKAQSAVMSASASGKHYAWVTIKPWDSDVQGEVRYRLEKLGFWCDRNSGPLYIGWNKSLEKGGI